MKEPVRRRMRGPLAPYVPEFRTHLASLGFGPVAVKTRLSQFGEISRWLEAEGLGPSELTEEHAARFITARRAKGRVTWVTDACMAVPLNYLRSIGIAPTQTAPVADSPLDALLADYRTYLVQERALAAGTVKAYVRIAEGFSAGVQGKCGGLDHLHAGDVTTFVVAECGLRSIPAAKKMVTALASFLRYLHVAGITSRPLMSAVPRIAERAKSLPRGLDPSQVARLLSSCDRRRMIGRRDFSILTLLVRLGLRAGEVAALRLDDIDWHHGEIVISGKGNRHEPLPLPKDVGEALAAYLRYGRQSAPDGCRTLFLRVEAPAGGLTPNGVGMVVVSACRRAGLPAIGAHRLRHTAATAMLRHGVPLHDVAQVLRHRSLQVTATYAKVERAALHDLAQPWPGGTA